MQWVSWRWVLFVNVPIGIVVVLIGRLVLPETERARGAFDVTGALTSTIGMASLVYGFVRAATDGWSGTWPSSGTPTSAARRAPPPEPNRA